MQEIINSYISAEWMAALSHTIIQSIWQGIIIGIISAILLHSYKNNARARYNISIASLLTMGICTLVTFLMQYSTVTTAEDIAQNWTWAPIEIEASNQVSGISTMWMAYAWFIGVSVLSIKMLIDMIAIQYLRQRSQQLDEKHPAYLQMQSIRQQLKLKARVVLKESNLINSPITVGWLKPIILFPVGMINQLTIEEVESILTHELAHIMRHDYLINLIQSMIEIVLFYHPIVWWLSKIARQEREYCCDDIAMVRNTNQLNYAKTLVKIQELKSNHALALSFADQSLLQRIQRIMNLPKSNNKMKGRIIAILGILCCIALVSKEMIASNTESNHITEVEETLVPEKSTAVAIDLHQDKTVAPVDTLPYRQSIVISQDTDDGHIVLKEENGEIKELSIDGKVIPKEEYDQYQDKIDAVGGGMKIFADEIEFDGTGSAFKFNGDSIIIMDLDGLEEFSKDIAIWGEAFGERFGEDMQIWGENFGKNMGQSFEEWGEKLGEDMDVWFHNWNDDLDNDSMSIRSFVWPRAMGDSSRVRAFTFPETLNNEEMEKQLEEMLQKLKLNNGEMEELLQSLPQLNSSDIRMYKYDSDDFPGQLFSDERFIFPQGDGLNFGNKTVQDKIGYELRKDRLIEPEKTSKIELTGKHLKIDGDKQPKNIWNKYKSIFEEASGIQLSKDSKLQFDVKGKRTLKKSKSI